MNEYDILWQEIESQGTCIQTLLAKPDKDFIWLSNAALEQATVIVALAEGSSLNSLKTIEPLLTLQLGKPLICSDPHTFEATTLLHGGNLQKNPLFSQPLFLLLSQSGKTASLVEVLGKIQSAFRYSDEELSGRTLLISNAEKSPLSGICGKSFYLDIGEEQSIPATKTVSASLLTLLRWALCQGQPHNLLQSDLPQLGKKLDQWLTKINTPLEQLSKKLAIFSELVLLSDGPLAGILPEAKLKLTEILGLPVHIDNFESFKHGPKILLGRSQDHPQATLYFLTEEMLGDRFLADIEQHWLSRKQEAWLKPENAFWLCCTQSPDSCLKKALNLGLKTENVFFIPELPAWDETTWFYGLLVAQVLAFYWAKQLNRPLNPNALSKAVSH